MNQNPYQTPQAYSHGPETFGASSGGVSPGVVRELVGTKPWVRLFAVLSFIGSAFMIIAGLMALVGGASLGGGFMAVGVIYLIFGGLYLFPALKLWGYGSAIFEVAVNNSPQSLEKAINQQRQFWKFMGIVMIVGVVLGIVAGVLAASMGAKMASQMNSPEFQSQFQAEMEKAMREAQSRQQNQ